MQMYSGPAGHFWLQPAPNEGFMGQGDLGLMEPGTGRALQQAPGMLGAAGGHLLESPLGPPAPGPCPSCRALLGPVQALCYVAGTGKSLPKPALTTWFLNRNSCAPRLLGHHVHHVNSCVYLCFSGSVAQLLGETPCPAPPGASRGPRADGDSSKVPARARTHTGVLFPPKQLKLNTAALHVLPAPEEELAVCSEPNKCFSSSGKTL